MKRRLMKRAYNTTSSQNHDTISLLVITNKTHPKLKSKCWYSELPHKYYHRSNQHAIPLIETNKKNLRPGNTNRSYACCKDCEVLCQRDRPKMELPCVERYAAFNLAKQPKIRQKHILSQIYAVFSFLWKQIYILF